jgi:putative hydrolase of the HAD superfamily
MFSSALVKKCIKRYRAHPPKIILGRGARNLLISLRAHRLYLVTDGNKLVQARKIAALGLEPFFRRIFITHRYGVANAKPSLYCFERIKELEQCAWEDIMYVGDNPAKDFVNLNKVGAHTVRVLTGSYKDVQARPGYEARFVIPSLTSFQKVLRGIQR